ncbi:polysaccharide lyase [Leptospira ognonensis]|uniref:Polysaccharide lyase n=2 Tax=Leptospira ognonensis TaxID=2484945 RepID=A0A4R9K123_9LEPT|nr:polysaccharide lyase [Leptospira ognonensis]
MTVQCQKGENENSEFFNWFGLVSLAYQSGTTIVCTQEQLQKVQAGRSFTTGFESLDDVSKFYSVPLNYQSAATHSLSTEQKVSGSYSHKATIFKIGPTCGYPMNCNHRGYPTIQLHKLNAGGFKTPVLIEFSVYLDMPLSSTSDWFSFATYSADASDDWKRVVLINTDFKNKAFLMHVPLHNQSNLTYQNPSLTFPGKQWVKMKTCLNLDPNGGEAKVWQDEVLVSTSNVSGGCGVLEQAHFGLYASPTLSTGTVYNDDLTITEVNVCP